MDFYPRIIYPQIAQIFHKSAPMYIERFYPRIFTELLSTDYTDYYPQMTQIFHK